MEVRASFPPEVESATAARHLAEKTLADWRLQRLLDTTRLLVSELVINAVRHAGTESQLVLRSEPETLRVEVVDGSTELPVLQEPEPFEASGRGLLLVEDLTDRWGVEVGDAGKTVWFELAVEPVAADADRRG